ncbi:MAG: hypothetical protein IH628_08285, partial [Proteobacteria bacterium]|nr:hypothetical protein [Pseudomonadota bacterium]
MIRLNSLMIAVLLLWSHLAGQTPDRNAPKLKEPVLLTSCGQSPGPLKFQVFLKRLGIPFEYNLQA